MTGPTRQRGFALLIVMFALGLLALITAWLTSSGRAEFRAADAMRSSAMAEAAADGGVEHAMFALYTKAWSPAGAVQLISLNGARVAIEIEDQANRFNPNYAPPTLIATLFSQLGLDAPHARDLANRVFEWRIDTLNTLDGHLKTDAYRDAGLPYGPTNHFFKSFEEIGLVLGMTPDLLTKLEPYLSVYQGGDAVLSNGDNAARAAVQDFTTLTGRSGQLGYTGNNLVAKIRAVATMPDGVRFLRTAVVRFQSGPGGKPWQILTWD